MRGVIEAGNDLQSYPGLPEDEALDDLDPGEDIAAEALGETAEEALET